MSSHSIASRAIPNKPLLLEVYHYTQTSTLTSLWHRRLGHINFQRLCHRVCHMTARGLVDGVPLLPSHTGGTYKTCILAKHHRMWMPHISFTTTTRASTLWCVWPPTSSLTNRCSLFSNAQWWLHSLHMGSSSCPQIRCLPSVLKLSKICWSTFLSSNLLPPLRSRGRVLIYNIQHVSWQAWYPSIAHYYKDTTSK